MTARKKAAGAKRAWKRPAAPLVLEAARWVRDGGASGRSDSAPAPDGRGGGAGDPVGAEVRRLAALLACKAAVKAGMPLRDEEVRALLSGASAAADPRFCPHGRPTGIEITRGEIERRFQRK